MNKLKKIIVFSVLLAGFAVFSGFSQTGPTLEDLQRSADSFSTALAKSLPFNSTLGLNWSDAYIGKLLPSAPPHFGIGGVFGVTTMDMRVMKDMASTLDFSIPFDMNRLILPAYTAEARIGGLFLPFDVGVKFGMLRPMDIWGTSMAMEYTLMGAEFRYALVDGKDHKALPNISIGVGYNYLKGGIESRAGSSLSYAFNDTNGSHTLEITSPHVGLAWETSTLDFKAQISKSFLIITPYAGVGVSLAWSKAGYTVDSGVKLDNNNIDAAGKAMVAGYLAGAGLADMNLDSNGFSSTISNFGANYRVFGGFSLNLSVIRLDLTGLYSFGDKNYGLSLGARFQL
ncbi:MAG: hypothetical protein LBL43_06080 [Treponema sp.]|nr:hypothetical protein [Treponema sp.]